MTREIGKAAIDKLTGVTPKIFDEKFRAEMKLPANVIINDITLREGRQIEGTILTEEECERVTDILINELNVPMIQMVGGYNERDTRYLKTVANFVKKSGKSVRMEAMTSAHQNFPRFNQKQLLETISNIADSGFGVVICLASSDNMLKGCALHRSQDGMSVEDLRKQEIEIGVAAIEHALKLGMSEVNVNFQDFLRADLDYLKKFSRVVADAGAGMITLDDFGGGLAIPRLYTELFQQIKAVVPETALGVHAHNSAGMAVACALASVEGGCEMITVGVNAYGDGAGHVSLAETVYCLEYLYGIDTGIKMERLRPAAVEIADMMRQDLPIMAPLVGDNAFVLIADKHHSFPEYPFLFCPMVPELVGNEYRPGFGERAGPFGIRIHSATLGFSIPDDKIQPMLKAMEEHMRWHKRKISDAEFRTLAQSVGIPGATDRPTAHQAWSAI